MNALRVVMVVAGLMASVVADARSGRDPIVIPNVNPQPLVDVEPSQFRAAITASNGQVYAIRADGSVQAFDEASFRMQYVLRDESKYSQLVDGVDIRSVIDRVDTSVYFNRIIDTHTALPGAPTDGLQFNPSPTPDCNNIVQYTTNWSSAAGVQEGFCYANRDAGGETLCYIMAQFGYRSGNSNANNARAEVSYAFCSPRTIKGFGVFNSDLAGGYIIDHPVHIFANLTSGNDYYTSAQLGIVRSFQPLQPMTWAYRAWIDIPNVDYRQYTRIYRFGRGNYQKTVKCYAAASRKRLLPAITEQMPDGVRKYWNLDSGSDRFIAGDCEAGDARFVPYEASIPVGALPLDVIASMPVNGTKGMLSPSHLAYTADSEESGIFVDPDTGRAWWFAWPVAKIPELPSWGGAVPVAWYYGVYQAVP